ncbi:cobalt-precorrin-6A reductase [Marichromatium gracile]|uniref:cobalt-precorrin-6A reductase n=1 Tax=Marichromatium gracile TaxID=1048 RepID=UPI001F26A17D|nr:cobalt-precorrin-6A reductase [Marichromatium gracile]MCF1184959.1 cobalt-precorrin-6A reductase [Marichromatium gracile]
MRATVIILGGTTEGYALAEALAGRTGIRLINSLAGRTDNPRLPAGETRVGGFGGAEGLADFLLTVQADAVIDATHPFAAAMGWNAHAGCAAAAVPLLRIERPAWQPQPGDQWFETDDWAGARARLSARGARRVLLALGRQELAPFAGLDDIHFLIRAVSAPDPMPPFADAELLLARGPFGLEEERDLLDTHRIDTIVCKNSGGTATAAKLTAARERGIEVVMRRRPPRPQRPTVARVDEALAWLERKLDHPPER